MIGHDKERGNNIRPSTIIRLCFINIHASEFDFCQGSTTGEMRNDSPGWLAV